MYILGLLNFCLLSTFVAGEHQPEKSDSIGGREFSSLDTSQGRRYFYPTKADVKEFLYKKPKEKRHFIHEFKPHRENLNTVDEIHDQEHVDNNDITEKHEKLMYKKGPKTSPALSAVALLGFLYFLNLIQNVLQGSPTGKKRREVTNYVDGNENIADYLMSFEEIIAKLSNAIYSGEKGVEGRGFSDIFSYFTGPSGEGQESEERASRVLNFVGSLISKIQYGLGMKQSASSRNDQYLNSYSPDPSSEGFWSMFGSRIGLVAKIMDFLNDPRPSRVARSSQFEEEREDIDPNMDYANPIDLSEEDKQFLPLYGRSASDNRVKRYAEDEMNIWYTEADPSHHSNEENASGQLIGMVFNLFKHALTS
ncbi:UNVERIFIED_CONTAM: hypothetical protein RMT77_017272 [Armadillidium vulgare]